MSFVTHNGKKVYTWWADYGNTIHVSHDKPREDAEHLVIPPMDYATGSDGSKHFISRCPWLTSYPGQYWALIIDMDTYDTQRNSTWRPIPFNSILERDAAIYGSSFFDHGSSRRLVEVIVDMDVSEALHLKDNHRVIVAGSRGFTDYEHLAYHLDKRFKDTEKDLITIISGGAKGADALGERYAKEKGITLEVRKAEWDVYGRSAGYRRNVEMANMADACICFWDGESKGTKHMIDIAERKGLELDLVYYAVNK
tara:strand:- start:699 stop:1460 length:762 start_codon:yes stop_codon:yes gene_type:complete